MENPPLKLNETFIAVAGGFEIEATYRDSKVEKVLVKELHISQFPSLMGAMGDELRQVELFCDKPPGWALTLSNQSIENISVLGSQLNDGFFVSWGRRRMAEQEKMVPGITAKLRNLRPPQEQTLKTGSPKLPSDVE